MSVQLDEIAKVRCKKINQIGKKKLDKLLELDLIDRIVSGYFPVVQ